MAPVTGHLGADHGGDLLVVSTSTKAVERTHPRAHHWWDTMGYDGIRSRGQLSAVHCAVPRPFAACATGSTVPDQRVRWMVLERWNVSLPGNSAEACWWKGAD